MGVDSNAYRFVLALHILTAIVGFGAVFLNGLYFGRARRRLGREGQAIVEANYDVSFGPAEWAIYATPLLGILLVLLSADAIKFSDGWISVSFLLVIVWIGLLHGLHKPNVRRMRQAMADLSSRTAGGAGAGASARVAELEQRERRASAVVALLDLILIVIVFLMVFGSPR